MADSRPLDISALQADLRAELENLCSILIRWLPNRKDAKRELLLLADKLNKHQKNVSIAKLTGATTSLVGTGFIIGGFAASFFTLGISLVVSAVGAGIGGLGGLTAAGASITQYFLNKEIYKSAQEAIDRDRELTMELLSCLERLEINIQLIRDNENLFNSLNDKLFFGLNVLGSLKMLGKNLAGDFVFTAKIAATAADLTADATSTVFKTMSTAGRVLHIGGFAVGMALVPLDLYTLVSSSISLHKGNTSDAENKIRGIVNDMMCPEEEVLSEILAAVKDGNSRPNGNDTNQCNT